MKLFIKKLIFILFGFYLFAEVLSRVMHITTDAPSMYQNTREILRYYPNQSGYWEGGHHKWYINELGFPGKNIPDSYTNLVTLIGPSNIENFMNPDSCRQMEVLRKIKPSYNYLELSMSGVNILDSFELIKEVDTLNPQLNIIFVIDKSFTQSIKKKSGVSTRTQLDFSTSKVVFTKYTESSFKKIMYNFKFAYYLYRKNLHLLNFRNKLIKQKPKKEFDALLSEKEIEDVSTLIDFIKKKYRTDNVVFIFNDRNSKQIYNLTKSKGIYAFRLDSKKEDWTLPEDSHWSCYGHHQVAKQISLFLDELLKKKD